MAGGSRARSPSPDHSSKRAKYDEHRSSRSRHEERYRDEERSSRRHRDSRRHEEGRSRRDRDREHSPAVSASSEKSRRPHRSDREREKDRERSDRDRDRSRRDGESSRRDGDRKESGRERESRSNHRDSPRESHRERDSRRDKDREREKDGSHRSSRDKTRDVKENGRDSRNGSTPSSPRKPTEEVQSPVREKSAPAIEAPRVEQQQPERPKKAELPPREITPVPPPAVEVVPHEPAEPLETPEEKKKREQEEKRKRLEAWKAQKAAEKAKAQTQAAPPKPVNGTEASAPKTKPVATKPVTKSASKPISTNDSSAKVAAPPKLALGNGISITSSTANPIRTKAATFMGEAEDAEETDAQLTMFKPDQGDAESTELPLDEHTEHAEESDDEDLVGDDAGDERTRAEERREQVMREAAGLAEAADPTPDDVDMAESSIRAVEDVAEEKAGKKTAMEVDAPPQIEEDDEVDPLEAYMSEVIQEKKKIDLDDMSRGSSRPSTLVRSVKLSAMDVDGVIEDDDDGKVAEPELDPLNMTTAEIMAAAAKKAKKKDVAVVDHSKIDYDSFRKAFYHPPPEIQEMTDEDADLLRLQLDGIKIRGVDCPKPVTKWSFCGLPAVVLDVIKSLNYAAPTSIQTQAIPAIMSGRDVIGVAKTGSGKTIAFLLPLFRHIKDQRPLEPLEGPIAMIMTPTRELATQIYKECKPFLKVLNLRATCLYGGSPLKDNIAELKRGVEIVVCTPGRMIELLSTNSGKIISMRRITYLVLDEADRMFDMGFEPQVTKIIQQIRPDRQTVLFSATFPKQMEALARKILKKPLEITVGGRSVVAPEIEQIVEVREEDSKFMRLLELLGRLTNDDPEALALIFVDRHESADDLLKELMNHHYVCQSLHGGKEQVDRDQTLADFKAGIVPIVIATSVAARGLDVKQLKLVVNYDAPNHMEDYVHRAGRTGRAGNKGTCVTFITPEQDKYSVDLFRALEASGVKPPQQLKDMAEAFLDKVKQGRAGMAGSGFGGKGLDRFDKDREATRKAERTAYGGDEEVKQENTEETEEGAPKPVELKVEIRRGAAPEPTAHRTSNFLTPDKATAEVVAKIEREEQRTGKLLDPKEKLRLVQASLNASLRSRRQEHNLNYDEMRMEGASTADYHAILPINDYPQKARWRVTNKETMSALVEETGASVTNKGVYYPPGREPMGAEAPKLHLLIEANDEDKVKKAIQQLKQILLETSTQVFEAESRANVTGRYTV